MYQLKLKTSYFVLIGIVFVSFLLGSCATPPMRRLSTSDELPATLASDLKDRFTIKEALPNEIPSASPIHKEKNLKKSSIKNLVHEKNESNFIYPNRRPKKEPFWVGEKLVYSMNYFAVSAGDFTMQVMPFKKVGNRKVYHTYGTAVSSSVFSLFYRINDMVESYIDYEGLFSHRFHIVLDETKQTRDSLELNDSEKKQTFYWNRWQPKDSPPRDTQQFSDILPFSQDTMSALYYIRTLKWEQEGMTVEFPVVSEGKYWYSVCTLVKREVIDTVLGEVKTLVIKLDAKFEGILKKQGDSFLWLTDDDRKIPVRLEAKVKIGTVVAKLKQVELGNSPDLIPFVQPSSSASLDAPLAEKETIRKNKKSSLKNELHHEYGPQPLKK